MKNKTWGNYERMRPDQIEEVFQKHPIAYIPWGALEYHSYHNPIGLDGIKAHGMCEDLAKKVGGLVMPPIYLAANLIKTYPGVDFPKHSIEFSEKLIRMICEEYLEQLVDQDFKIIVVLTGHAGEPHFQILNEVAANFNKKYPNRYCWSLAEFDILPDEMLTANHSALGETSLQMVYAPDLIAMERLPQDREITLVKDGIAGRDPRPSTVAFGNEIVEAFLKEAEGKMKSLIEKYQ